LAAAPPLDFASFRARFDAKTAQLAPSWEAIGFLAPGGTVYAFGTDSKVISTVFETIAAPILQDIAEENGYEIEGSPQTIYPDFTLTPKSLALPVLTPCRIAIDIKTTFRRFTARKVGRSQI
jgi:hypothetical protein